MTENHGAGFSPQLLPELPSQTMNAIIDMLQGFQQWLVPLQYKCPISLDLDVRYVYAIKVFPFAFSFY